MGHHDLHAQCYQPQRIHAFLTDISDAVRLHPPRESLEIRRNGTGALHQDPPWLCHLEGTGLASRRPHYGDLRLESRGPASRAPTLTAFELLPEVRLGLVPVEARRVQGGL